jgi:2-polyprenyl-3-methyl-5-hydroxy-6-metoxy-1,4-benzoquinol methylase
MIIIMHNQLPNWLSEILKAENVILRDTSFLEDVRFNKDKSKDFELEWQEHVSHKMIKTWGFDASQRVKQTLIETETSLNELEKLTVLDAGCGNGILTEALSRHGAKVLGVDLIKNLPDVIKNLNKSENLFFLRADINDLPIKEASFDLIISNGVLHHTPNTKEAFLNLSKLVKTEGKFYVWLYRKPFQFKNKLFLSIADFLRKIISRLPKNLQKPVVKGFTIFFYKLSRIRKGRNTSKSYEDLLIDMYDSFTPKYRNYHNPIEVANWFHEASFSSPVLTHWNNSFGFGMYAIKKSHITQAAGENFDEVVYN